MKKVIILGAGEGQLPFINICKRKGCYVIVIGRKEDAPGFRMADKIYYVDIKDKNKILKIARTEKIHAILSDQSDYAVPTIAYVSEHMALKSIGYERALIYTNKYRMRVNAKLAGIHVPQFYKAHNIEEVYKGIGRLKFPIIIKPVDSAGSRGIHKLISEEGLQEAFEDSCSFSVSGVVIVEEFIDGKEYIVDGFGIENDYINLDIGEKEYFKRTDTYISKMCMFTSANMVSDEIEKKVLDTNRKLVGCFGLPYGITHAEYIVDNLSKEVYLVEIAARGGGIFLSSELTPRATGIHTNELLIDYILDTGKTRSVCNLKNYILEQRVTAWVCFELISGFITKISAVEELHEIEGVFKVCLDDLYEGKKIAPMLNDLGKQGPILIEAGSRKECREIIDKVKKTLKIETVDEAGNKNNIIW